MTDLPDAAADRAADASTPDIDTPAGDPQGAAVPAAPVALTDGKRPRSPRRRRSLALRLASRSFWAFCSRSASAPASSYAWSQQYDGRILPGVFVGSTELGGLTREQAEAKVAEAFGSLGIGQITLTRPDGRVSTIDYADLGRGPDTSTLLDAAFAIGRRSEPLANLIGVPQAALHGVTLDPAVVYDHDKLAAAVDAVAATTYQNPTDAFVWEGPGETFHVSLAKDGHAVDKTALMAALEAQLAALGTPASIDLFVPVVPLAPAVPTASAEAATAAADRMTAESSSPTAKATSGRYAARASRR